LALLGLGINSIILEDFYINSLGCLISSSGMLLVVGAFGVLGMTNLRQQRRLTNFGDLYQRCNTLLYEIDHTLNMAIPSLADRPALDIPEIPSVVEMALDSLTKQAADWQQKLRELEERRLMVGPDAPMELTINIDFVQREFKQVRQEIDRISGWALSDSTTDDTADSKPGEIVTPPFLSEQRFEKSDMADSKADEIVTPTAREIASSKTAEMPVFKAEEAEDSDEQLST
jgi:hypothetical protein